MNKNNIKNYAMWARNELITRVTQKAFEYGVSKDSTNDFNADNINGKLLTSEEKQQRQKLISEVREKGFDQVMEEVAYTWFNRFIALRYMEVNNYLPNRIRVFTNENNEFKPQLLDEAATIELDGLDKEKVYELLDSNKNEELYKLLLLATCNDMHNYLPGMFETIHDYKVLLFPENLLRDESILGKLISDIDEDSWQDQVQIIGWMYQFYNTEPKDKVMGRKSGTKIKKEEVPAVTQLFTPDWIVRYMVENSLGRLWLDGHEDTGFKSSWKYYLDEAKQEPAVLEQLKKIREEHSRLKLEDIKFIDPCMGSGHILVYAFDVFMQLYQSEGYTPRDAAKLILENNLYGLDIDERAYQLAYFALMMKGREYSRRIFNQRIELNLMAIKESNGFNTELLDKFGDLKTLALRLVHSFEDAKEYGSILNVNFTPNEIQKLNAKVKEIQDNLMYGDLMDQVYSGDLLDAIIPLIKQATIMSQKYDTVVTNPPYMPISNGSVKLQNFAKKYYPDSKTDLFAIFMEKANDLLKKNAYYGMINMHSWMFLSSYEKLRSKILKDNTIINMAHLGARAFEEIGGEVVQTTAFINQKNKINNYFGTYVRLTDIIGESEKENLFISGKNRFTQIPTSNFAKIPGSPIAYWVPLSFVDSFTNPLLYNYSISPSQNITGNNNKYTKLYWELDKNKIGLRDNWIFYCKGGGYRKWYGNLETVVNWTPQARKIYQYGDGVHASQIIKEENWYKKGITWGLITSGDPSFRIMPEDATFDKGGSTIIVDNDQYYFVLGLLNTKVFNYLSKILNPTINLQVKDVRSLPIISKSVDVINEIVEKSCSIAKEDYDSFETSWDFTRHPLVKYGESLWDGTGIGATIHKYYGKHIPTKSPLELCYLLWQGECNERFSQLKENEEELNKIFIDIYGLQEELDPYVEDMDVTVRKADLTRDIKSFISYAVGCMFGRYSLNVDGLAYAGGEWDNSRYSSFIPDADNIIPICDDEYFEDDIVGRFIEFVKAVYGEDSLDGNLQFIADALGGKGTSREVIRNYFLNDFYKDHCNTYQVSGSGKRPIYWLFDSGKKNGFKALMYIHRYTPDLIARMRTQYVHELQAKYRNQIELLEGQIDGNISSSERVKLNKQLKKFKEQDEELRKYEEVVHHWADKMEPMDLDDGVKANYAKLQPLLAKIK